MVIYSPPYIFLKIKGGLVEQVVEETLKLQDLEVTYEKGLSLVDKY